MMLGQGEAIVVAGATIGVVVFCAFARLLRSLAYGVSVVDAASIAAAVMLLLVVATLANWIPARRAARIDPTEALRGD